MCLISGMLTRLAEAQNTAKPAPDVVVFKNGDQLTGTLVRGAADTVIFKSDVVGEVTISMNKVKELRSSSNFAILKKGEKITRTSKQTGSITFSDSNVTIAHPNAAPETVATKDLAYIIDKSTFDKEVVENPGIWYGWKGVITGGATIIQSTQTARNYAVGVTLSRAIPTVAYLPARTRTTFDMLETYGKLTQPTIPQTTPPTPDSVAKTNIFHADAEHDKYFSPRVYALADLAYDHNYSQGLNLQQIYGGGLGTTIIQDALQQFDVKGDVHYEMQKFQPPTVSQNLIGSTFSETYKRNLPAKMLLTESGTYIQSWNNFKAYSAVGNVGLALPVYKRFSLSVNALDNYLNNPAAGYKKNSFQFITGVTYTLP